MRIHDTPDAIIITILYYIILYDTITILLLTILHVVLNIHYLCLITVYALYLPTLRSCTTKRHTRGKMKTKNKTRFAHFISFIFHFFLSFLSFCTNSLQFANFGFPIFDFQFLVFGFSISISYLFPVI